MTADGVSRLVVKKILNHVERDITAVYDRFSYDKQKKMALDGWGRQVTAIIEQQEDGADVIPISRHQPRAQ
jgi:hypothetical protein